MEADLICQANPESRHQKVLLGAILASLAANLLYPGEVFFQFKFLIIIVSILTFLAALILRGQGDNSTPAIRQIGMVFGLLLFFLPSTIRTINHARSQDVFVLFFAYACLFGTLQLIRIEFTDLLLAFLFLLIAAFCINVFSVYQYFFGLSELKALILNSTVWDEKLKSGVLTRIITRRVFANFALPNTLAGFVTMVLPLNIFLLYTVSVSRRLTKGGSDTFGTKLFRSHFLFCFLVAQVCLSVLVLALTQSFGGWVCFCFVVSLLASWTVVQLKISLKRTMAGLLIAFVVVSASLAWVTHQRGFSLWNLQASGSPIALRLNNYKTAVQIFHDFPKTGVGLGNYGTVNPLYQSSPATVSQYAHNTGLQLLSEMGVPFLAILLLILIAAAKHWRTLFRAAHHGHGTAGFLKVCLGASLVAWLIHNMLDIDFFFPSVGALGIFLSGILANTCRTRKEQPDTSPRHPKRQGLLMVTALSVAFLVSFVAVRDYLAESLCSLAMDHAEAKDYDRALHFMNEALAVQGNDAAKFVVQAKLSCLNAEQKGREGLTQLLVLRKAYERAIQLDPFNASYHHELSRVLFALGETELALRSRDRAIKLFPSEPKFKRDPTTP